jgi:hypothetical protein
MIEQLPNKLIGMHLVALYGNQSDMKFGYENPVVAMNNRLIQRQSITHDSVLAELEFKYLSSYKRATETTGVTLLHIRDCFLGYAIYLARRNSQGYDLNLSELTNNAIRFNSIRRKFTRYERLKLLGKEVENFRGLNGTLSSYAAIDEVDGSSIYQYLTNLLQNYYSSINLEYLDLPAKRQSNLLSYLLEDYSFVFLQDKLLSIYRASKLQSIPNDYINEVRFIRQNLLSEELLSDIKLRILLGEYPEVMEKLLYKLDINVKVIIEKLKNLSPPSGMVLFYLANAVEGYLSAALAIMEINDLAMDYQALILNKRKYKEVCNDIALALMQTSDALSILGYFNTLKEARKIAYLSAATSHKLAVDIIKKDSEYRLTGILSEH